MANYTVQFNHFETNSQNNEDDITNQAPGALKEIVSLFDKEGTPIKLPANLAEKLEIVSSPRAFLPHKHKAIVEYIEGIFNLRKKEEGNTTKTEGNTTRTEGNTTRTEGNAMRASSSFKIALELLKTIKEQGSQNKTMDTTIDALVKEFSKEEIINSYQDLEVPEINKN